jgi:predicted AAA+ superfamily ATPase
MIHDALLEEVVLDQAQKAIDKPRGIKREVDYQKLVSHTQIVVIAGMRRAGKSTLMLQLSDFFSDYYYINFDDERLLGFETGDFNNLLILFKKRFISKTIFMDEVQNVPGWERFVRRIYDEDYKVFITGSNAKLLSSELATHLTGRYHSIELFPFSFSELGLLQQIDHLKITSAVKASLLALFDRYLQKGGMPEYYKLKDDDYFSQIYSDIIYKDLIVRFAVKNVNAFKNLSRFLLSNFTKEISYSGLSRLLHINSVNTVKDYIDHLQECYLLFECHKFDFSLKRQYVSNKKIYAIDNGIRNHVSFRFNTDNGQLLENIVFVQLRRIYKNVTFYKTRSGFEVDFYCNNMLIQVCWTINDQSTLIREKRAITEAMQETGLSVGYILTYNEETSLADTGKIIHVIPVWKWMLEAKSQR